ncbi:MAG: hypothetical protein ACP5TE_12425 [Verrucomicrobiia bacterium]|jgi:hypothetical protein
MKPFLTNKKLQRYRSCLQTRFPLIKWLICWRVLKMLENYREDPRVVSLLIEFLDSDSRFVSRRAEEILLNLTSKNAIDTLCEYAILNPKSKAARICLKKHYKPSDNERLCLFLFVTGQLEDYFKEDPDFAILRIIYEHADQNIRERIMDVVREGDIRCQPFAIMPRKSLVECTEQEIKLALESCIRHQDWDRLFTAALELPLKYSLPVFLLLKDKNWIPKNPDHTALFEKIKSHLSDFQFDESKQEKWTSKTFEIWLSQGRRLEYQLLSEEVLLRKLDSAKPTEGVTIVAALARKQVRNERVIDKIRNHPHWLIRLAGVLTGITKDIVIDRFYEVNWWVKELAGMPGVLEFWPQQATPEDLSKLNLAPQSAYEGVNGKVRSILRDLLQWRITTGTFAEMVIEATPTSAEFVRVGED